MSGKIMDESVSIIFIKKLSLSDACFFKLILLIILKICII